MAEIRDVLRRVRSEIGDPSSPFRTEYTGDGITVLFDLPRQQICESSLQVLTESGATVTEYVDYTGTPKWSATTAYTTGTNVYYQMRFYTAAQASTGEAPAPGGNEYWTDVSSNAFVVNPVLGKFLFAEPIPLNAKLIAAGSSWALFSDKDLYEVVMESVAQHTYAQETEERYRDARGFVGYRETPKIFQMLPQIEVPLIVMLAVINCFWSLANDAATDSNIQTAEGTSVDRTTRYTHLMNQIDAMTARYTDYCNQLNVGLYRWETLQLRRTSKTTGRLVATYKSREYDDFRWPVRLIPPVDGRNMDNSGVPSPLWSPCWGF